MKETLQDRLRFIALSILCDQRVTLLFSVMPEATKAENAHQQPAMQRASSRKSNQRAEGKGSLHEVSREQVNDALISDLLFSMPSLQHSRMLL